MFQKSKQPSSSFLDAYQAAIEAWWSFWLVYSPPYRIPYVQCNPAQLLRPARPTRPTRKCKNVKSSPLALFRVGNRAVTSAKAAARARARAVSASRLVGADGDVVTHHGPPPMAADVGGNYLVAKTATAFSMRFHKACDVSRTEPVCVKGDK
ncbi:Protein of unknown function [Gryllus bimaculatus]|nr:Protein of unknown function [Gryllus bimaculatus]